MENTAIRPIGQAVAAVWADGCETRVNWRGTTTMRCRHADDDAKQSIELSVISPKESTNPSRRAQRSEVGVRVEVSVRLFLSPPSCAGTSGGSTSPPSKLSKYFVLLMHEGFFYINTSSRSVSLHTPPPPPKPNASPVHRMQLPLSNLQRQPRPENQRPLIQGSARNDEIVALYTESDN